MASHDLRTDPPNTALQPCPECKAEISSRARFCPRCGYPFELEKETAAQGAKRSSRRPFGILLGVSMCVIGTLLLLARFLIMLPFCLRHSVSPLYWQFACSVPV